jgi:hypothetical protein
MNINHNIKDNYNNNNNNDNNDNNKTTTEDSWHNLNRKKSERTTIKAKGSHTLR